MNILLFIFIVVSIAGMVLDVFILLFKFDIICYGNVKIVTDEDGTYLTAEFEQKKAESIRKAKYILLKTKVVNTQK